jgi:biotin carboxyl carrier protein
MKYEVQIGGQKRVVEVFRDQEKLQISLDGELLDADAVEVAPNTFSILLNGASHEVRIAPAADGSLILHTGTAEFVAEVVDPRAWRGRRHGAMEAEGRQQIVAPMPGKVVKILVNPGESVQAGQGLIVVEAMKMQNEIRSPKSGTLEKILAKEGQPVNAGEVLAWVE